MKPWALKLHAALAIAIVIAVPLAVYAVNGVFPLWAFLLGAGLGGAYWYIGPVMFLT